MTDRGRGKETGRARSPEEVAQAESFGRWLQAQMDRRNLSMRRLADDGGLGRTTVQMYVNGRMIPKAENIRALAKGLDVPEGVVWYAAGYRQPGSQLPDTSSGGETSERMRLRRLVDEVREERLPYVVQIVEAFIEMDASDGSETAARPSEPPVR